MLCPVHGNPLHNADEFPFFTSAHTTTIYSWYVCVQQSCGVRTSSHNHYYAELWSYEGCLFLCRHTAHTHNWLYACMCRSFVRKAFILMRTRFDCARDCICDFLAPHYQSPDKLEKDAANLHWSNKRCGRKLPCSACKQTVQPPVARIFRTTTLFTSIWTLRVLYLPYLLKTY